jgi:uncharacterized protein
MAVKMLGDHGHRVLPVHPDRPTVCGLQSVAALSEITEKVDTLTMYVNASISKGLGSDILKLNPRRVIFNPGAENAPLEDELRRQNIEVVEACTLVMLRTGQF